MKQLPTIPPVVDIYCRTATENEETQAKFEQQESECRAYCEEHGLEVGTVYHEVAPGNTYRERPHFSHMRARYFQGDIQGVVVSHLDRISRSQVHLFILMEEMNAHSVTLHCVHEELDEIDIGRFIRLILKFFTEVKREEALDTLFSDLQR